MTKNDENKRLLTHAYWHWQADVHLVGILDERGTEYYKK